MIRIALFIFSLYFFSSTALPQILEDEDSFIAFLNEKEMEFDTISVLMGEANWNLYAKEGEVDLETPRRRYYTLLNNDTLTASVDYWFDHLPALHNSIFQRRVAVWHNMLTGSKVDMSSEIFSLEDKLEKWLATEEVEKDEPAKEELENLVISLMKIRNEKAIEQGYKNYAYMVLDLQGLDPDYFFSVIELLDRQTSEEYNEIVTNYLKEQEEPLLTYSDTRKLFYAYYFNMFGPKYDGDTLELLMRETIENIGIDYASLPARFVIEEIPFGGNGLAIHIPDDFRAVLKPNMPITVWLHELGHGLQAMHCKTDAPILKGYEWMLGNAEPAFAEGMAELNAKFSLQPEWLFKYTDKNENDFAYRKSEMEKYFVVYVRFMLARVLTEIAIYENTGEDFTETRNKIIEKYLGCQPPPEPFDLTTGGILVSYPVYLQNYLFAEMISWQIHTALRKKFGNEYVFDPNVKTFLEKHLWAPGESEDWKTKLRHATGSELDVEGYLHAKGQFKLH